MNRFMHERVKRFILVWRGAVQRFTLQGKMLAGAYVATLPFVIDVRLSLVYQLFGLILAVLGLSLAWVFLVRVRGRGFSMRRSLPAFVTAGDPFSYECVVRNHTDSGQDNLRLLERVDDIGARFTEPETTGPIPPGGEARLRIHGLAPRRGVLRFTSMSVAIPDPLGCMRAFFRIPGRDSLPVLPKRYPVPDLALSGRNASPLHDAARQSPLRDRGESQEFAYLRDYRHGDPIRRIHWKGWPKYGGPVVKEFQDEQRGRYALFLDCAAPDMKRSPLARAPAAQRKQLADQIFESAVSVAASWAAANWPDDTPLDLLAIGSQRVTPSYVTGPARTLVFLRALASAAMEPEDTFDDFRDLSLDEASMFSGVVLVLPAPSPDRLELISAFERRDLDVKALAVTWDKDLETIPGCRMVRPATIAEDLAWP